MSWWKFWKDTGRSEAEREFQNQLNEAFLNRDDLRELARKLKEDRLRRLSETQRRKLNSQTS